jgi:CMP-N,N'-diacetyllegionaminic acid synthase
MKILATVCARKGSKGVRNKNIREVHGKPLIAYTIELLKRWNKADRIVCSTDSEDIARAAREAGALTPFLRPKELATDEAGKIPVLKHALVTCEKEYGTKFDIIMDLDPTSPLRQLADLDAALALFHSKKVDLLYSVAEAKKNPYFNMVELDENGFPRLSKKLPNKVVRRQDAPKVYELNASIYIYDRDHLMKMDSLFTGKAAIYVMDAPSAVDIDNEVDLHFVEFLLERGLFKYD